MEAALVEPGHADRDRQVHREQGLLARSSAQDGDGSHVHLWPVLLSTQSVPGTSYLRDESLLVAPSHGGYSGKAGILMTT